MHHNTEKIYISDYCSFSQQWDEQCPVRKDLIWTVAEAAFRNKWITWPKHWWARNRISVKKQRPTYISHITANFKWQQNLSRIWSITLHIHHVLQKKTTESWQSLCQVVTKIIQLSHSCLLCLQRMSGMV